MNDYKRIAILEPNKSSNPMNIELLPYNRLIVGNNNQTMEVWCLNSKKSLQVFKDHDANLDDIQIYIPIE